MKRFRFQFSLVILLIGMTAVAFSCVALPFASEFWASTAFTICVGLLLFSSLAALFRRDAPRAFWVGFLVFGCVHLLLVFGPWFDVNVKHRLLTSRLLGYVHGKLSPWADHAVAQGALLTDLDGDGLSDLYVVNQSVSNQLYRNVGNGKYQGGMTQGQLTTLGFAPAASGGPPWDEFQQVGHSLFTILCAVVGGHLARSLWRSQRASDVN